MKTLLIIAWRNIWRHPARSGVLLAAIVAGLWAGVLTTGIINGMMEQRMNYMIESEITHVQIHHPEFRAERKAELFITDHEEIKAWLEQDSRVSAYTTRVMSTGMLQSPVKTAGVMIRGIDPQNERKTTTFNENLSRGDYLDVELRNPILLGESLAREHNMEIGNRVVLTFENLDGELTSAAFNISGLFKSASSHFDDSNVFVRSVDLTELLGGQSIVHEFAMMLTSGDYTRSVVTDLNSTFNQIEANSWFEISPELGTLQEFSGIYVFILNGIILIALAFGILNTMLMALFERMRELGVLISIGMSRFRVFSMITFEAIIISLSGAAVGIVLAGLTVGYLNNTGINLEMFAAGIEEIGWPTVIYPFVHTQEFVYVVILVIFVALLSAVYPAWKAFRINPVEVDKNH